MDRNNKNKFHNKHWLKEELQLIKEIQSILQKEYGYSPNEMESNVSLGTDPKKMVDLVVFDEKKSPIIVAEIKIGQFVLPLSEYELKEILVESRANFGLLYNGIEKRFYQRVENSVVQIYDIPKKNLFENNSTTKRIQGKFKPLILSSKDIWSLAEKVRLYSHNYEPLLQILALKILDEEKFEGDLFKKYLTKPFTKEDVNQFIKIGRENFPILFSSSISGDDYMSIFIELLNTIKNFSVQESDTETIAKVILKFRAHKYWYDFPEELSNFMLNLLSIQKNKKILIPYGTPGYPFHISKFLEKNFKLNKKSLRRYLENFVTITEMNEEVVELLQIISLLLKESMQILATDFLQLDQKFIDNFQYILCMHPIGAYVNRQIKFKGIIGFAGKQLINYLNLNLQRSQKYKSKVAILMPSNFLYSRDYPNLIRRSILKSGFLRAIIKLPSGIFNPVTKASMALIIIDFHKLNTKNRNWDNVFLSEIPEITHPSRKLDIKILTKIWEDFKKFEKGQEFENTSLSFVLHHSKLAGTWTVSDKTPEMQKILKMPYGVKLGSLGKIFYGKAGPIEVKLEQNNIKIPYLRINDIEDGLINYPIQRFITIKDQQNYSEVLIQEDDVLLSCQGTVGKVALARKKDVGILPSPWIIVIRPNKNIIFPEYLIQALSTEKVQYQIQQKSQGTYFSRLNIDDLRNIIISNPPLSKQIKLIGEIRYKKEIIEDLEGALYEAKKGLSKLIVSD